MAKILDYINQQINNINSTLSDEEVLREADLWEITNYIARNPKTIYGGSTPYFDAKQVLSDDTLILASYGITAEFLTKVKEEAKKQPPDTKTGQDTQLDYFLSKTIYNLGTPKNPKY